jgi:LPXTG-site transpeptidase (sortase) family protein
MPKSSSEIKAGKKNRLSLIFVLLGFILLSTPFIVDHLKVFLSTRVCPKEKTEECPGVNPAPTGEDKTSFPIRILIPRLSVDLPVQEAKVEGNNWELFEDAASFLSTSAKIGQKGNTVIYAHAKFNLFGPIKRAKKGDRIYILTNNNWAIYEVFQTQTVPANKIEVVLPTAGKTLTLYTCTSFLDKDRFVVSARLKD